jgi:hypothetical protein
MPKKITPNPSDPFGPGVPNEPNIPGENPNPDRSEGSSGKPPNEQAPRQKSPFELFGEHQAKAAQESWEAFQALFPPEFKTHSRAASHEFTQSFKVLLDGAQVALEREMERIRKVREAMVNKPEDGSDDSSSGNGPSSAGKSKVKIEVN